MLPIHQIETFLQRTPAHLQDIVVELRNTKDLSGSNHIRVPPGIIYKS